MFNDVEVAYLRSGGRTRLARLATVGADGFPVADVVGFGYADGEFIVGHHTGEVRRTRKGRNVAEGRTKVSLVIDDWESVDPWLPRGIRVQGEARIVERAGRLGHGTYLIIRPVRSWSWGLVGSVFETGTHRTDWAA
jgi:pyridoxamine 5'-phosphate oxidase family protein